MATGRVPTTANSPLTAKGDLFGYSTTQARVAVGNNGETLVADSSTSTGLRYTENYAAGKNKIINGDMNIWQRGTSFTPAPASVVYTADRFYNVVASGTTVSRQAFTAGTAPVAGYEGQFYMNQTITANNQNYETGQRIENARTFAGQTVTLSFWARSTVGAQPLNIKVMQNFGTGGSPSASVNATYVSGSGTPYTPTSSWQRFTFTLTVPSVSGKTFGTNNDSYLYVMLWQYTTTATNTSIDIWGVQLEAGSVATAFQTATGTLQGELAACQRYYYRLTPTSTPGRLGCGNVTASTTAEIGFQFPVPLRITPTAIEVSGTASDYTVRSGTNNQTCTSVPALNNNDRESAYVNFTFSSGLTAGDAAIMRPANTSAFIGWSAEL
jgi:hypothetical protein